MFSSYDYKKLIPVPFRRYWYQHRTSMSPTSTLMDLLIRWKRQKRELRRMNKAIRRKNRLINRLRKQVHVQTADFLITETISSDEMRARYKENEDNS